MRSLPLVFIILALTVPLAADPVYVTNTNDSGPGSLRAAIETANEQRCGLECTIEFRLPQPVPEVGWFTIQPRTPLPYITADRVKILGHTQTLFTGDTNRFGPEIEIDGSRAGLAPGIKVVNAGRFELRGVAVNRFGGNGVVFDKSSRSNISESYIGVDPTGVEALPNGFNGIALIRSSIPTLSGNIVSGNGQNGVFALQVDGLSMIWNRIGVGRVDGLRIPNGANGVDFNGRDSFIAASTIHNNPHYGIKVSEGYGLSLPGNSIANNGLGTIHLPVPRDVPVLTRARATAMRGPTGVGNIVIDGTLRTQPHRDVNIHFYASPHRRPDGSADARRPLGHVMVRTNDEGLAVFTFGVGETIFAATQLVPGGFIAATASMTEGTSELSAPIRLETNAIEVTTTEDSGPGSLRAAIEAANAAHPAETAWISFHVGDGSAQIAPRTPLPAITRSDVIIDGTAQTWWSNDINPFSPELEILGTSAGDGATGLRIGSQSAPVKRVSVRDLAINGFDGDGLVIDAADATDSQMEIADCHVTANGGDGIVFRGGSGNLYFSLVSVNRIRSCTVSGNGGHGIVSNGVAHEISTSTVERNGGNGILFAGGNQSVVKMSVAANENGAAGVAVMPETIGILIEAETRDNATLGIDRAGENVLPPPQIVSATYDPATNRTKISGLVPRSFVQIPGRLPGSGFENVARLYASRTPDPSGRGEGERAIVFGPGTPLTARGETFVVDLVGDYRGLYITAVNDLQYCYWELGCPSLDSSEHSNAVKVE